uniref:Uncharacterized protein n=1 Tax=Panagrolaimus davidi TaxID=227884 RepID=A0A914PFS0_9BILA
MDVNYLKRKPESLSAYYNFLSNVIWDDLSQRIISVFIDELELLSIETSTFVCTLTKENEPKAAEMHQNFQTFYVNLAKSKFHQKFENDQNMLEIVYSWKEYEESEYGDDDVTIMSENYTENEINSILTNKSDPIIQKLMQYFGQTLSSERNRKYDTGEPPGVPRNDDDDDYIEC